MSGSLVVVTQSGLVTLLEWWSQMVVEGLSLVLCTPSIEDEDRALLVVATLRSTAEAEALFRTVSDRLHLKARRFDIREWPGLANPGKAGHQGR